MIFHSVCRLFKFSVLLQFVFITAFVSPVFAQSDRPVDSLLNLLKTAKENNRKVNVLNSLSKEFWQRSEYGKSKKYAEEALALSERLDFRQGMANAYQSLGEAERVEGNSAKALKNYMLSQNIWEEVGNKKGVGFCYTSMGIIYARQGNHAASLKNHLAALAIGKEVNDKPGLAGSYNHLGLAYSNEGRYEEAMEYHRASLNLWKEIGNKRSVALCHNNIGMIYLKQDNPGEALQNFKSALKLGEEIGDKRIISIACTNIGKIHIGANRLTEAREYLVKALALSLDYGLKENTKDTYFALSQLYSNTGDYRQAFANFQKYSAYKDSLLNENNSRMIAELREQFESEKKDKEIVLLKSEKQVTALIIKSKDDSLRFVQSEKEKIRLEKEKTDALNLYNQQQLALLAKEKRLQELQIEKNEADMLVQKAETQKKQSDYLVQKAEADRKQEQLLVLNKEKTIQNLELKKQKQAKNFFIAGLALFAILSFFVYRNYRTRQKLKLQTLRNKIARDLHDDVGSTLSSISIFSQMAQEQSKETIPLLETIGESSRKMLDAMADIVWTINPENDQFEKIILRMRSFAYELLGAKQIDFEFVADEDVAKMKLPMDVRKNLYLIFKEATNNMVKYSEANRAFFEVKREGNDLTMLIRDNGKGFDINQPKQGNGIINMRKRAGEMEAVISIDSLPEEGTTIQLKVAV